PGGSFLLARGQSVLRSTLLRDRRPIAGAARAQSADRPAALLRPPRVAHHPGLLRRPRRLCLFAVVARIPGNVVALEICPFDAKHRSAWRHRLFPRLVACSGRPVLSPPAPNTNSR